MKFPWKGQSTWRNIFKGLADVLVCPTAEHRIQGALSQALSDVNPTGEQIWFSNRTLRTVLVQFRAHGLAEFEAQAGDLVWSLTRKGVELMTRERLIKRTDRTPTLTTPID